MADEDSKPDDNADETGGFPISRRTFLWMGGLGTAGALAIGRFGCYSSKEWDGNVLSKWEAHTLAAAAAVLIPDEPGQWPDEGPSPMAVARHVDAYLTGMPRSMLREIRGMFGLIEHGTILHWRIRRFTRQSPQTQLDVLEGLYERGGMLGVAFEGLRALCYVGWYQDDRTWEALGYSGPLMERDRPVSVPAPDDAGPYAELVAEPGAVPRGVL